MKRRNWGRILNIASTHGLVASAQKSAYVASKHGMIGFTRSIAIELGGDGITVNAVGSNYVENPDYFPPALLANREAMAIAMEMPNQRFTPAFRRKRA